MQLTKTELKKLFTNLKDKGITDNMADELIEHCYNNKSNLRTSGFFYPGGIDAVMSWNETNRTLTLSPFVPDPLHYDANGDIYVPHFRFFSWYKGPVLHRKYEDETLVIPNEEGLIIIHFAVDQESRIYKLSYIKDPTPVEIFDIYLTGIIVAWIYYLPGTGALYFGNSRHGSEFIPAMHFMEHQTLNSRRELGITIVDSIWNGDGSEDSHFQFGISAGSLWHEDIRQEFDAVASLDSLPVWYFDGSGKPRFTYQTGKKFITNGLVAYNSGGAFVAAQNEYFVLYHLFATNCQLQPHISVMGQAEYQTVAGAYMAIEEEVRQLRADLPHSNLMHIGTVIIQTSESYTNLAKARLVTWGSGSPVSPDIRFEFCIEPGQTYSFTLDIYVTSDYKITRAIMETDTGSLSGISIEVNGAGVAGITGITVTSSRTIFDAIGNNQASESNRVTLEVGSSYTGTPSFIRGKIVLE
jgi:hypothetical protein